MALMPFESSRLGNVERPVFSKCKKIARYYYGHPEITTVKWDIYEPKLPQQPRKEKLNCDRNVPIWKRRGVKPIEPIHLDPIIRSDGLLLEDLKGLESLVQIVRDPEWVLIKDRFEAHSLEDIEEGVVINPPMFPAWYASQSTGKISPAQLPHCTDLLLEKALKFGYERNNLVRTMGVVAADYSVAIIHPKKRAIQKILILAGRGIWQGDAALFAARRLHALKLNVCVYLHGHGITKSEEELSYLQEGGRICRNLADLSKEKFKVTIVAIESQYGGMGTNSLLPLYGEYIQHSAALFIDPPVLKCSYTTALQVACRGSYNISQKTAIFVPSLPKTYVIDHFIDLFVVDIGIIPETHAACGMEHFNFRRKGQHSITQIVVPQKFSEKGSKIYFYENGVQVP